MTVTVKLCRKYCCFVYSGWRVWVRLFSPLYHLYTKLRMIKWA